MRKIMLAFTLIITTIVSFSQSSLPDVKTKQYYLAKSHHQRTIARIMLGGGIGFTVIGFGIGTASIIGAAWNGNSDPNGGVGAYMSAIGILSTLGSIPLFVSSAHNKHKAATLTLKLQKVSSMAQCGLLTATNQPAITLKIDW